MGAGSIIARALGRQPPFRMTTGGWTGHPFEPASFASSKPCGLLDVESGRPCNTQIAGLGFRAKFRCLGFWVYWIAFAVLGLRVLGPGFRVKRLRKSPKVWWFNSRAEMILRNTDYTYVARIVWSGMI